MIGGELHDKPSRQPRSGQLRTRMGCSDQRCPSRGRCERADIKAPRTNFSLNRGPADFCGYLISKEATNG